MKITKSKLLLTTVLVMSAIFIGVVKLIDILINGIVRISGLNYAISYMALLSLILFVVQYFYLKTSESDEVKPRKKLWRRLFYFLLVPFNSMAFAFLFSLPVMTLSNGFGIFISLALIYLACGVWDRMKR